ncbi:MAG: DUF1592 domain-containing protein [Polyangiales bacterium]
MLMGIRGISRSGLNAFAIQCALLLITLSGCSGEISMPGAGGVPVGREEPECDRPSCDIQDSFASSTAFARLTHSEYANSVRDLLRIDVHDLSDAFTKDTRVGTFDNNGALIRVSPELWFDYQAAAEQIAERAVNTADAMSAITPSNLPSDATAQARSFVTTFGERAYRRPLEKGEVDAHVALFTSAQAHYPNLSAFNAGVRLTIEAMLQSPFFLYRVERSTDMAGGVVVLDNYEVATRLSYALTDSMPDAQLFAAAAKGELKTDAGIETQVRRLLDTDRAKDRIHSFFRQLLNWDKYDSLSLDTTMYPSFNATLRDSMKAEAEAFVDYVVLDAGLGLRELLTASYTFANESIAGVYGIDGVSGPMMQKVDFTGADMSQRSGLLTQLGFLATNSGPTGAIHRGVFINDKFLCTDYPGTRPSAFPPQPTADDGNTWRERIDKITGEGTCGESCHVPYINAAGFAFENFDDLGQFRTEEFGFPVDATTSFQFYARTMPFDGASQLAHGMVENFEAHDCYSRHWLEYLFGREASGADSGLIQRLGDESRDNIVHHRPDRGTCKEHRVSHAHTGGSMSSPFQRVR